MEKVIELRKGTEVTCKLSMSQQVEATAKATIRKYCRVYGTQTVIDGKDPKKKTFFLVKLVDVTIHPKAGKPYNARLDARCICMEGKVTINK